MDMSDQGQDEARLASEQVSLAMAQLEESQRILDYDTKEWTLDVLIQKFTGQDDEDADIYVPPYQRKFNWGERKQSRFIESLLIGLPIPFLFFADMPDGRLEVVDGNQRINTCKVFLSDSLTLVGLERIPELDGFQYRDLSKSQRRRLRNRSIRAVVLSQKASEEDRRDLFDRINTGSLIAQPVEVRRGAYPGPITDLIDELANDQRFIKLCPITETAKKKREGEELITRLFCFGEGLDGYRDRVKDFLRDWVKSANQRAEGNSLIVKAYRDQFHNVMCFVEKFIPQGFAKKPSAKTTPRVRFDALAVGALLAIKEDDGLLQTGPKIAVADWLDSDDFFALTTSSSANVRSRIERRQYYVKNMLLGKKKEALSYT